MNSDLDNDGNHDLIRLSFTLTYVVLITTGTITFIEALRTEDSFVRHIMNLETCISLVAGYFYGVFIAQIGSSLTTTDNVKNTNARVDWSQINKTRYIDWCITTPLMLLCLCLVLGMQTKRPIHLPVFLFILILNYAMLYTGYLGETGSMSKITSVGLGFIPFFVMFFLIYSQFVYVKYVRSNYILFFAYLFVWSLYGIVYLFDVKTKNICFNALDFIAKSLIGLGLWVYYTRIIQLWPTKSCASECRQPLHK